MSYTLYDASIGHAKEALKALSNVLTKAKACENASKIPEGRIIEDMLPFTFQVHSCTMVASKMASRVSGQEVIDYQANLTDFASMEARVAEVQKQLDSVDKDTVNGRVGETVGVGMGPGFEAKVQAWQYVHGYGIPNIFFHLMTAYNILRKEGGQVGKFDYLGPFMYEFIADQMPEELKQKLAK